MMKSSSKKTHIEFSDGDTAFISVSNCPLEGKDIKRESTEGVDVVCCWNSNSGFKCEHFYKLIVHEEVTSISCSALKDVTDTGAPGYTKVES